MSGEMAQPRPGRNKTRQERFDKNLDFRKMSARNTDTKVTTGLTRYQSSPSIHQGAIPGSPQFYSEGASV